MLSIFRDFKRHYHKAKKIYAKLADSGTSFSLNINFDGNKLSAKNTIPNEKETVQFVVLMRRFLSPSDLLYYGKVWAILQELFADEVPSEVADNVTASIERLNKGYVGININGDDFTAEKVYQIISEGEYFGNDEKAQSYLRNLAGVPIVGPLFWSQFYSYTLEGFALVWAIFGIIKKIEESSRYKALYDEPSDTKKLCIYCLTTTASFASEEHIFPESLGNDELVLPKGYVCDACNHGILSELDNALLKFEPIAFLQVQFVPYTKDGKLPRANFQNVYIERTGPRNIRIVPKDKTGDIRGKKPLGDDWYSFKIETRGKTFDPKPLGRALYKIALGLVALEHGNERACDNKYDAARAFILKGLGFPNNLLIRTKNTPHSQVRAECWDIPQGTPFAIDIYGLVFLLNLEPTPIMELNEDLIKLHFQSCSLQD
jgi:hypothetical protein